MTKRKTGPGEELRPESLESARANLPKGASLAEITAKAYEIQKRNDAEQKRSGRKGKKGSGEQARLPIDAPDIVRKHVTHEVARPMSQEAFAVTAGQAAREHNRIKALQKEIHDFANAPQRDPKTGAEKPSRKKEIAALMVSSAKLDREVEAEAHLIECPCIEVHNPNTRTVTVYLDDNGIEGEKISERVMTVEEFEAAVKSRPFDPPMEPPEGDGVEVDVTGDAEAVPDPKLAN